MPQPRGRDRLSPDDLAKQIAERLADSGESRSGVSFSLRNSVFVGRMMSGLIILALAGGLAFAVTIGVNWFMGRSTAATVEAAPIYPEGGGDGDAPAAPLEEGPRDDFGGFGLAPSTTTTTLAGPFAPTSTPTFSTRVTLPPTTTTTAPATATTNSTSTSSSSPATTLPPPSTSPTTSPTTTSSTTLPSSTTTGPTTTTTTAPTTTTTTAPTTTTTTASTTTTTTEP